MRRMCSSDSWENFRPSFLVVSSIALFIYCLLTFGRLGFPKQKKRPEFRASRFILSDVGAIKRVLDMAFVAERALVGASVRVGEGIRAGGYAVIVEERDVEVPASRIGTRGAVRAMA